MEKEDGAIKMERSCTDILCCLIYLFFIVVMVILAFYGISKGDPLNILTPFDTLNNKCGAPIGAGNSTITNTRDFTEYKYKFFTNLGRPKTIIPDFFQ